MADDTFNYKINRLSDADVLAFLQGEGYDTLTGFVTNADGSYSLSASAELADGDLADIADTMINIDVWEWAAV